MADQNVPFYRKTLWEALALPNLRPGLYRVRLVKGGPWVAARVTHGPTPGPDGEEMDRSWVWTVEVDGEPFGIPGPCAYTAGAWRVSPGGQPIEQEEYDYMVAMARYARLYDKTLPEAAPRLAVDMRKMPPSF